MASWWKIWTWGSHDCEINGHRYTQRYDEMIDPRLTREDIGHQMRIEIAPEYPMLKVYVRDICSMCGDVIERVEGKHPLEVLALQAKRK